MENALDNLRSAWPKLETSFLNRILKHFQENQNAITESNI